MTISITVSSVIMLNVSFFIVMLSVIMASVVMLSVVGQKSWLMILSWRVRIWLLEKIAENGACSVKHASLFTPKSFIILAPGDSIRSSKLRSKLYKTFFFFVTDN